MTCAEALDAAAGLPAAHAGGCHAALVFRPGRSVVHAYAGPLTPSGRHVPRGRRTVCGCRTRRLTVTRTHPEPSQGPGAGPGTVTVLARLCRTCSVRLASPSPGQAAGHTPQTGGQAAGRAARVEARRASRDHHLAAYHASWGTHPGQAAFHLAVDAYLAQTEDEIRHVEWLALLLVGLPALRTDPVTSPAGKVSPPLAVHVTRARIRLAAPRRDPHSRDPDGSKWRADTQRIQRAEKQRRIEEHRARVASVIGYGHSPATQHLDPGSPR